MNQEPSQEQGRTDGGSERLSRLRAELAGFRRARRHGRRFLAALAADGLALLAVLAALASLAWLGAKRNAAAGAAWITRRWAGGRRARAAAAPDGVDSAAAPQGPAGSGTRRSVLPRLRSLMAGTAQGGRLTWQRAAAGSLVLVAALGGAVYAWALRDIPWQEIAQGSLEPIIVLESADGATLVQQGPFRGAYAERDDFPPHLVDAVLSIEDRRFYEHWGIDLQGIGRAAWRNLLAGEVLEGGSTVTQQLVKILYLERERTFRRKIQEAVVSLWLERRLGKDEILTRYLNNVYLGAGATGMPAAARIYFDKEVSELTVPESAMLAGLIQAPSQLNPLSNLPAARERASVVLGAMAANGKLAAEDLPKLKAEFAELRPTRPENPTGSWFADWVMTEAREIAGPFRGTVTVRTTLVPELQRLAEEAVREELGTESAPSQAALVALAPDGAVVALVGGADYAKSSFNRATALRQPGSTFKLFVYYAALKAGFDIRDTIEDAPIEIDGWSPENAGGAFRGRVSLAEAFARSLNAAAVRLMMEVGPEAVIAAARELGLDAALAPHPSLALGTVEASLLDMTGAYGSIRAGAAPVEPWGVLEFRAGDGSRAFRAAPALPEPSPELAALQEPMVRLLRLVVERGTGREARLDGFAAGKTGTTQNNRDAWFVGFNEALVVGVWVGNDDNAPMEGVTGGTLPARIWRRFMTDANALLRGEAPGETAQMREDESNPEPGDERATEATSARCDVRACSRAYRSFRASDCTYRPYRGERRLCTR